MSEATVTCPACGENNRAGARFCDSCGSPLEGTPAAHEERKVVSVLFVDLVGFTERSDRADPEDVRDVLRLYHARVKQQIERYGGVVEKFIGDAVMAVFGAPVAHGDDAERAIRAGLRALEEVGRLELPGAGARLAARAAVETGEAVVALGAHAPGEALAMGDVVNTAARLQTAAPPGRLLVGADTYRATRQAISYEPSAPVVAKGKEEPLQAWLAVDAGPAPSERPLTAGPMVGRERELQLLASIWQRAAEERRPHLVTVVGPPGIGKSRLAQEIAEHVEQNGGRVFRGRCHPYDEETGYPAFGRIVKQVAGVFDSEPPSVARAKLEALAHDLLPDEEPEAVARYLSLLLGLRTDEPARLQVLLFYAARRFVEELGTRQPTLLIVEDIHWSDASQLDLVDYLASHIRDTSVVVLAMTRPELADRRPTWGAGLQGRTTVALEPLGPDAAARVARSSLREAAARDDVVSRLLGVAEGNPLFIEELAAALLEGGSIDDLPVTVRGAIAARVDALPPEERTTLVAAAVVGKTFWRGILAALAGEEELDAALEALEARDLIRREPVSQVEGDLEFSFRHILIREVAYALLPRATRRERHAAVAHYVEREAGEEAENLAWVLAHHWREAGEPARAVRYLLAAAERAREGWARDGVIELYSTALELATDPELRARIRLDKALALTELGDYAAARAEFETVIPRLEGRELAEALLGYGHASLWTEQTEATLAAGEQALELAQRLGDQELMAPALALVSEGHAMRGDEGDLDIAIELGDRALANWVPGTRQNDLGEHLHQQSNAYYWTGQYARAIELSRDAKAVGGEAHSAEILLRGGGIQGLALAAIGKHEEAFALFDTMIEQGRELGRNVGTVLNYSTMAYRELYELAEARRRTEEALALKPGWAGFNMPMMMARTDLLVTDLLEGEIGRAETAWQPLWEDTLAASAWHRWLILGKLAAVRSELALAAADAEGAANWARQALQIAVRTRRAKYEVVARTLLGEALGRLSDHEAALVALRPAVELADRLVSPPGRWQARAALGRELYARGDDDGAAGAFDDAAAIVRSFAAGLKDERAARFLKAEPIREMLGASPERTR